MRRGTELLHEPTPDPWWVGAVPALDRVRARPPYADGWSFVAPVIDMPVYLGWLRDAGRGRWAARSPGWRWPHLPEGPLVVELRGLGSRRLADDPTVTPVRGQVVRGRADRARGVVAGRGRPDVRRPAQPRHRGRRHRGRGEWDRTPAPETADDILRRATALVPELAGARVLRHRVGLRPARPAIRLERVGDVVHCYGHGGAGVTLSWGCADGSPSRRGVG